MSHQQRKTDQLGMPIGTASNRLRKLVLFKLLQEFNRNICFQCGKDIESADHLSVEHKKPWLDADNPKELFWDLNNIAFSHLTCNIVAGRKPLKKIFTAEDKRAWWRAKRKRQHTPEKRRQRYLTTGH